MSWSGATSGPTCGGRACEPPPSDQPNPDPICLFERKRVSFGQFRHEREHRKLGIAVHKHVLDELVDGKAVDRIFVAAGALREVGEDLLPIPASGAAPSAGWVHH